MFWIFELIIIAIALSMDAFAVTLSSAISFNMGTKGLRQAMRENRMLFLTPIVFGLFQGIMPTIGYFIAGFAENLIHQFSAWISLIILGAIGAKMCFDGIGHLRNGKKNDSAPKLTITVMLLQGIATSIDALIVGVDFQALGYQIALAAPIIAIVTCLSCMIAIWIGQRFNRFIGDKAEIVGGLILIIIGVRIFLSG